jgi:hypothetical protein
VYLLVLNVAFDSEEAALGSGCEECKQATIMGFDHPIVVGCGRKIGVEYNETEHANLCSFSCFV